MKIYLRVSGTKEYRAVLIDSEDHEILKKHTWVINKSGYAIRRTMSKGVGMVIIMHRLLLKSEKNQTVDHINGNRLDNRKSNLRICTSQQNSWNQQIRKNNKYGYKGITLRNNGKYQARIRVNNKCITLGCYESPESAAIAYNDAALLYFNEFARLNNVVS